MQREKREPYLKMSRDIVEAEFDYSILSRDVTNEQIDITKLHCARMLQRGIEIGITMSGQNTPPVEIDVENINAYLDGYNAGFQDGKNDNEC